MNSPAALPFPGPDSPLVPDAIAIYLKHALRSGELGPSSLPGRRRDLTQFAAFVGDIAVNTCKRHMLTEFAQQGLLKNGQPWAPSTKRTKVAAVMACFNWLAAEEYIHANPFTGVRRPRESEPRDPMTDTERELVRPHITDELAEVLEFLRATGMRSGEASAFDWADIDFAQGVGHVRKHKTRRLTKREKLVVFTAPAQELLRRIHERRTDMFGPPPADEPVFLTPRRRRWSSKRIGETLLRALRRAGITIKGRTHGLRKWFCTIAAVSGAPIDMVAGAIGDSVETVRKHYLNTSQHVEELRRAADLAAPRPPATTPPPPSNEHDPSS